MKRRSTLWRIVAKALGEKAGKNNAEADRIAIIRLLIMLQILITNFFIIFNAVVNVAYIQKHWDKKTEIHYYTIPDYQPPPRRDPNKPFEFE